MNRKILEARSAGRRTAARRWFALAIVGLLAAFPLLADDLADVLERYGADSVDWRGEHGNTPLFLAARAGDTAAVYALIDAGADADARNDAGANPLYSAANPAVVQALILAGADVDARNVDGYTPLMFAIALEKGFAVVQALIFAGADVNARDKRGNTPLRLAARKDDAAAIQALIEAGADRADLDAGKDDAAAVRALVEAGNREETLRLEFREWVFEPCLHVAATLMRARAKVLQYETRQEYIDLGKALNPDAFEQAAAQAAREVRGLSAEERKTGYPLALMVCIQGVYEQHEQLLAP